MLMCFLGPKLSALNKTVSLQNGLRHGNDSYFPFVLPSVVLCLCVLHPLRFTCLPTPYISAPYVFDFTFHVGQSLIFFAIRNLLDFTSTLQPDISKTMLLHLQFQL